MNVALALVGILCANVALAEQSNKAILFPNDNGCPEDPSIDRLLPHQNCNQFYKCAFGDLVLFNCYPGTLFSVETTRCEWPHEVDCGDRHVPGDTGDPPTTEAPSPTQAPVVTEDNNGPTQAPVVTEDDNDSILFPNDNDCPEDPTIEKLLPHENCNQFYKCAFGKPVAFDCFPGTLFNLETMRCDWPHEVDCGDRHVPEDIVNPPATDAPSPTQSPVVTEDNIVPTQEPVVTEDDNDPILFPNDNDCPEDPAVEKLLPHENCNQFYICAYGEPVVFDCWPGTLFNLETMRCDWPHEVDCGDRNIPGDIVNPPATDAPSPTQAPVVTEDNNGPTQGPVVTEDDNDPILFPNDNDCPEDPTVEKLLPHENCNQFYKCAYGESVAFDCWPGTLFNLETMRCDWPHEVDCGDRNVPEDIVNPPVTDAPSPTQAPVVTEDNNGPTQGPVVTEDDNDPILFPNDNDCPEDPTVEKLLPHENCNQFYICAYGKPVAFDCWPGTLFNLETMRCDWPHEVDCGDRNVPEDIVNPPATDAPSPTQAPVVTEDNNGPTQAPVVTEDDNESILFPNDNDCPEDPTVEKLLPHENCNQFYICAYGKPVAFDCWPGTLFNLETMRCDWPHEVDCGDRNVPEDIVNPPATDAPSPTQAPVVTEDNNGPTQAPVVTENDNDPILFPNDNDCPEDPTVEKLLPHENCNQFYKCAYGEPVAMDCWPGTLFNLETMRCDWPHEVDCGDRNIPGDIVNPPATDAPSPTQAPVVTEDNNGPTQAPVVTEDDNESILFPNDNDCPEDPTVEKLLPHENCNQFYKCAYGEPVAMDCWPGTLFNLETMRCDWPHEVDCGDRNVPEDIVNPPATDAPSPTQAPVVTEDNNGPTQAPVVTEDDNESILFPNDNDCPEDPTVEKLLPHENCNQFYICAYGKPVAFDCWPGTLFNLETMRCDWPHEVDCGDRNVPEDIVNPPATDAPSPTQAPVVTEDNNGPTQAPVVTENDNDPILFPNDNDCPEDPTVEKLLPHENCNQFYKCAYGEPVAMDCWPGTLFNLETMRCDWPHEVDCGDRNIPGDIVNPPATDAPSPTQAPVVTEDNNGPTQAPVVTEDDNESILFPNDNDCPEDPTVEKLLPHENCNQFYKCAYGEPVAMDCWPGTLFNLETMRCDWPHEVDCGDRNVPEDIVNPPATDAPSPTQAPVVTEDNNGPTQAPVVTEDDNDPILFPNDNDCPEDPTVEKLLPHENCNQFYKCAYGEPVAFDCWPGTLFNLETMRCDWPHEVDCGDRNVPEDIVNPPATDAPSPTQAPVVTEDNNGPTQGPVVTEDDNDPILFPNDNDCPEDPTVEKLLPHENCNQFYKCAYGEPVAMDCWPGTLFNLETMRCDWPHEVDCGDRNVPEDILNPPATDAPSPTQAPVVTEDNNGPTQAPVVTEDDNESFLFPNDNDCPEDPTVEKLLPHENCNQFYKCAYGMPVVLDCWPGTLFNLVTMRCDWPEEVDCGERLIPGETVNPTAAPSPTQAPEVTKDDEYPILFPNENDCPEDPNIEKLLPHENCHQFYKCTYGEPIAISCWPGLLFNLETMRCDWPDEVDCGDRIFAVTTNLRKKLL